MTNKLKGAPDMKNRNERKILAPEEQEMVIGGYEYNDLGPLPDDLRRDPNNDPQPNNDHVLPTPGIIV